MQSYTLLYSKEALAALPIDRINAASAILIQIFDTTGDPQRVANATEWLESFFPHATIIGSSSRHVIVDGAIETEPIHLNITTFEESRLSSLHLQEITHGESFESGRYLAKTLVTPQTKAMILFCDYDSFDAESFLKGIRSVNPALTIAGGVAIKSLQTGESMLISNSGCSSKGAVAVALDGENLHLTNGYKSDWVPFGKKLKITHAEGKRVYSIDHMRAVDVFRHYLGESYLEHFDQTHLLFPLIKSEGGSNIPRTIIKLHDDGSLEFAGNIQTGERYQIGFGNMEEMLQNRNLPIDRLAKHPNETLFVYSCIARYQFMQDEITREIAPLSQLGNLFGTFTAGEFYSDNSAYHLLNQTMTILALSEEETIQSAPEANALKKHSHTYSTLQALSHLLMVNESELKSYQHYLDAKEQLLAQGPVVNFMVDLKLGGCSYISPNIQALLGFSAKEFINQEVTLQMLLGEEAYARLCKALRTYRNNGEIAYETDLEVKAKYGDIKHLHLYIATPKNSPENRTYYVGYCIDITRQVESDRKIRKLAFYDHITGLPNRELLKSTLARTIEEAKEKQQLCAVTFFDLDKFKDVNDTYGHSTGDRLLQLIAHRVKAILKKEDFIARIGGDEFILIHTNLNRNAAQTHILSTVNRILTIIHEPFNIDGKIAHISTSIGTAIYGVDGESADDLIKHADMAMYEAKKDPNIHFKFYSHMIKLHRQEELELKNRLKQAVKDRAFTLLYQPQVDIQTGAITGAEALMRWHDPKLGVVSPVVFIPIAEEMNLIVELGEWLLEEVCNRIAYLQSHTALPESFRTIAVNISPLQFQDPWFIFKVKKIIELLQIDTRYLEFELTEGVFVENFPEMVEKMHQLKALGITISLDDFGTGYSSLQYLKDLPVDTIKIDRSFISNLEQNSKDQYLTSTIIQLSQNMQCKIVAEGVESLEQLEFLGKNRCETYQGFYFSKPVSFEKLETMLLSQESSIEA